jgi:hypothetical protein
MSNRVRSKGTRFTPKARGRVTARPVGQEGFSIDREADTVLFAFHDYRSAFTLQLNVRDAKELWTLLGEAINEPTKTKEITRETGLIVTNRLPT